MAITIHSAVATTSAANADTSRALPAISLTAGRAVLVTVGYRGNNNLDGGGVLSSVTDSLGNTYTLVAPTGASNGYAKVRHAICANVTTGGSATISAHFGPGPTSNSIGYGCEMYAMEISGLTASPVVACVQSSGGTATQTTGTNSTSASDDHLLVTGHIVFLLGASDAAYSGWTNSFAEVNDPTTGPTGFAVATRTITGAGSWNTAATCSSANEYHTSLISLRGEAGGGPETVTGGAASTITIGGSAAGRAESRGGAGRSLGLAGTAAGRVSVAGQGAASVVPSGVASGRVTASGTATATVPIAGTADGSVGGALTGAASFVITFSGAGSGRVEARGGAAASVTPAGSAAGRTTTRGGAGASIAIAGTAAGVVEERGAVTGGAAGVISIGGAAAGRVTALGLAASSTSFVASAAGVSTSFGKAAAVVSIAGTATGHVPLEHEPNGGLLLVAASRTGLRVAGGTTHLTIAGGTTGLRRTNG